MDLSLSVLVVDDLINMRRVLRSILRGIGFKSILEASDGEEALHILANNSIGLIISDWNMPNMSGIEFLKTIRNLDQYKKTPFLMITAEATKDNIIEALTSGVSDYVVKPFQPELVEQKLRTIMKAV